MSWEWIKDSIVEQNPDAVFWDGLDQAIVGYVGRSGSRVVPAYNYAKLVDLVADQSTSRQEAVDWISVNIEEAWIGEHTPFILYED